MNMFGPLNSGAAAGGAGVATNNADSTIRLKGLVMGIYVRYNDSPPAGTTDVVISTKGTYPVPPTYNLLSVSNAATSGWFYPRINIHNTSGAAQASNWDYIPIDDIVNVSIAQANNSDSIDVWFLLA